jgi:hypothetical protein
VLVDDLWEIAGLKPVTQSEFAITLLICIFQARFASCEGISDLWNGRVREIGLNEERRNPAAREDLTHEDECDGSA